MCGKRSRSANAKYKHNRWLQKWLDLSLWSAGVWIRESRERWAKSAPCLHDELADVFSSFGTNDVEVGFNFTRRRIRLALSGTMQTLAQWHNLPHSNLEAEAGGQPVPSSRRIATCTRERSASLRSRLQKKTLSASSRIASENWMTPKDWHTPSASNSWQNVFGTSALVEFESDFTILSWPLDTGSLLSNRTRQVCPQLTPRGKLPTGMGNFVSLSEQAARGLRHDGGFPRGGSRGQRISRSPRILVGAFTEHSVSIVLFRSVQDRWCLHMCKVSLPFDTAPKLARITGRSDGSSCAATPGSTRRFPIVRDRSPHNVVRNES